MKQLHHNGVLVPPRYEGKGLTIKVREEKIRLTPEQEEMALAWAKKIGTPYVEDPVFAKNFHRDFSKKLGISVKLGDVDYSEVLSFVEKERGWKVSLSKGTKRQLAAQRKVQREANKERYGFAWVDGVQIDLANYAVEPNSIFMGRGKHPLRGRWKEGPREEDIEFNLSPYAPRPPGNWKAIVWQSDAMWIARWQDKLTGKTKYVWFSDASILKQSKDIEKFDKARELRQNLIRVQKHILKNLDADDLRRRKTATVCFLIDKLKIRVGDEKDPDEADTVGASTLRQEHIRFNGDGTATFNFLGKDAVPHVFRVELPDNVIRNLTEFAANARSTLFDGVGSKQVSEFLDEVMTGISAKVFRTCYASETVETKLEKAPVKLEDPEYEKKYIATIANLEAAKVCNHRRTISKTWKSSLEKKKDRLKALNNRAKEAQLELRQKTKEREERYTETLRKQEERLKTMKEKLEAYPRQLADRKQQGKPVRALKRRISLQREAVARQKQRLRELKTKHEGQLKKLGQRLESRKQRDKAAMEKLKLKIETQKETRDYNLVTSLKSYIDPRIYYEWGKLVDYDWKRYYPKTLQRKFSWVETDGGPPEND
jgi:DNA topoisomerase-1